MIGSSRRRAGGALFSAWALVLAVLAAAGAAQAQSGPAPGGALSACAAGGPRGPLMPHRHALIIANSAYEAPIADLPGTKVDAEIMCAALEALGFDVVVRKDLDYGAMKREIDDYAERLNRSGSRAVSFFYFSGHGAAQVDGGDNYLIPSGAKIESAEQLSQSALRLGVVARSIAGADYGRGRANFIIIDACRNVAFERTRDIGGSRGLAPVKEQGGALIAFATAPGETAIDDKFFSSALAREIQVPNRTAYAAFREVRRSVLKDTGNRQFPWFQDGLIDDFYFKLDGAAPAPEPPQEYPAGQDWTPPVAGREPLRLSGCPNCPEMMVVRAAERRDPADGPFAVSLREVTFDDWLACVEDRGCDRAIPDDAGWGRGDRPVINVSRQDAQDYVDWLAKKTGRPFRLPTDAEWTEAAAGKAATRFAHGDDPDDLCRYANGAAHRLIGGMRCVDPQEVGTMPVARFDPNAFGLFDTAGNVWEWVADCEDGAEARRSCAVGMLRGGSWESGAAALTPESRRAVIGRYRSRTAGFRVAMSWPIDQ